MNLFYSKLNQQVAHKTLKINLDGKYIIKQVEMCRAPSFKTPDVDYRPRPELVLHIEKQQLEHQRHLDTTTNQVFSAKSFDICFSRDIHHSTNNFVALTNDENVQIFHLDLNFNECVATLKGHSRAIECLEKLDATRFASGSKDYTIRIWDTHKCHFVCVKTIDTGSYVSCLKSLHINRIASGTRSGEISIWDWKSGAHVCTLNGHSNSIFCLICLPNGLLLSSSLDQTIKMWDLNRSVAWGKF